MKKERLMAKSDVEAALLKLAKAVVADGTDGVALVGIRTRGVPLANRVAEKITELQGRPIEVGSLDINLYRDDLSEVDEQPIVRPTNLPFSVTGKGIILVDDVLYTGRTIRSAMDALIDFGRPRFIKLMVLIDRGWRELPIQADYVAKSIKTTQDQNVKVMLDELDGETGVYIKGK